MDSESPNHAKTVCNIDAIMKFRLLFGYYYESAVSMKIRLLSKLYCSFVAATLFYYIYNAGDDSSISLTIYFIECLTYYFLSMFLGEKYIKRYYRFMPIVDGLPCANKLYASMEKILVLILASKLIARSTLQIVYCLKYQNLCSTDNLIQYIFFIVLFNAADLGRFVLTATFMLLFYRVKVMRNTMLTYGFDRSSQNRLTPRKYIQIYQTIVKTIEEIEYPIRFVVLATLAGCVPRTTAHIFNIILNLKENGPSVGELMRIFIVAQPVITLVIVAAVIDFTSEYVNEMLCFTIAETNRREDERERYEMQLLASLLGDGSLRYSVLGVVPLGVCQILGFFSFCTTTIIGILQIKHF